ncbi:hypothetical protein BTA30_20365 [Bacillus swezeyi]|uniref:Uncharacterized protein n=1 Tax=Bacillus swezeyi TaxID=1925020 RepID=A0A1R1QZL9_9BACI|nr:hypothetical protein BW143_00595 [Bacillus swezeyi]OMI25881.1 hypothetical protein BTA30_20365 [Bacillus swezeyi]
MSVYEDDYDNYDPYSPERQRERNTKAEERSSKKTYRSDDEDRFKCRPRKCHSDDDDRFKCRRKKC